MKQIGGLDRTIVPVRLKYCDGQTVYDKGYVDGFNCAITKIEEDFRLPIKYRFGIPHRLNYSPNQTAYDKGYVDGFDLAISNIEAN